MSLYDKEYIVEHLYYGLSILNIWSNTVPSYAIVQHVLILPWNGARFSSKAQVELFCCTVLIPYAPRKLCKTCCLILCWLADNLCMRTSQITLISCNVPYIPFHPKWDMNTALIVDIAYTKGLLFYDFHHLCKLLYITYSQHTYNSPTIKSKGFTDPGLLANKLDPLSPLPGPAHTVTHR